MKQATYGRALSYMIKSYIGSGVLSMPRAFQQSGFGVGVAILLFLLVCVTWNLRSLVLCKRHHESNGVKTYTDLANATLGPIGGLMVDTLINGSQLSICAVYFDLVAENLNAILPKSWGDAASVYACMCYTFPVFAALSLLPSVNSIAPYTGLANVMIFSVIFIVIIFSMAQLAEDGPGNGIAIGNGTQWPLFFATVVYSFEGITSFLPVENALKNRDDIFSMLYVTMAIVGSCFLFVGALSYMAWPGIEKGSITAQLAADHPTSGLFAVCSWVIIGAVTLTFPVMIFPAVEILETRFGLRASAEKASVPPRGFNKLESDGPEEISKVVHVSFDAARMAEPHSFDEARMAESPLREQNSPPGSDNLENSAASGEAAAADEAAVANIFDGPETASLCTSAELGKRVRVFSDPAQTQPADLLAAGISNKQKLFRVALVASTALQAALVPNLGSLIALVGAVSGSLLAIVLPALIDYHCPREPMGLSPGRPNERRLDIALIAVGTVGGIWSAVLALIQVVRGAGDVGE